MEKLKSISTHLLIIGIMVSATYSTLIKHWQNTFHVFASWNVSVALWMAIFLTAQSEIAMCVRVRVIWQSTNPAQFWRNWPTQCLLGVLLCLKWMKNYCSVNVCQVSMIRELHCNRLKTVVDTEAAAAAIMISMKIRTKATNNSYMNTTKR